MRDEGQQFDYCGICCGGPVGVTEYSAIDGKPLSLSQSFVGPEEKCPVLLYRSANCGAKLVALERAFLGIKEVARIECIIPEKLKSLTVVLVGPRTRSYVDYSARVSAVLGAKCRVINLEF